LNLFDGHLAVIGFAYDGKVLLSGQQVVEPLAEYGVIVDEDEGVCH
jgi:hypothetical protein